jgi:membrane protein
MRAVARFWRAARGTIRDVQRNHIFVISAGVSYYFFFSVFPFLIFLSAALAYIPIPNLFNDLIELLSHFVPPEGMRVVNFVLKNVLAKTHSGLLSVGLLVTVWSSSSGFNALIEALNVAYDVPETRPIWKTRALAIALTFMVGTLATVALASTILGPNFALVLAEHQHLSWTFAMIWPLLRWTMMAVAVVLAVQLVFYLGPNVKQRFWAVAPGALIGVVAWLGVSYGFSFYIGKFAHYNKTYGALGGVMVLMLWFYISTLSVLIGANVNSELLKAWGDRLPVAEPDLKTVIPVRPTPEGAVVDAGDDTSSG